MSNMTLFETFLDGLDLDDTDKEIIVREVESMIEDERDQAYQEGIDCASEGYEGDYDSGWGDGYDEGFAAGFADGQEAGD